MFGERQRRYTLLFVLFVLLISGCAAQMAVEAPFVPLERWTENLSYRFDDEPQDDAAKAPLCIVYYSFLNADGMLWCYPLSRAAASDDPALEAVNATLQEISAKLGLPATQAVQLAAQQGLATLSLAKGFFPDPDDVADNPDDFAGIPKRALDALVLTLTEFEDIERVQFLADGRLQNMTVVDWNPYDISQPFERPLFINDDAYYQGRGDKVTLYWQLKNSELLVPLTYVLPQGASRLQAVFDLLLHLPESLRLQSGTYFALSPYAQSPLKAVWGTYDAPKLCLQGDTLLLSLPAGLLSAANSDPQLINALNALSRTLLELAEVERIQFLVDDNLTVMSIGLFSLAEPIERLPFINFLAD